MGLDMTIYGERQFWRDGHETKIDGCRAVSATLELAYWRKHPDLHGLIVRKFGKGADGCKPIPLNLADIDLLIEHVKNDELPTTTGFFFGSSERWRDPDGQVDTLDMLKKVRCWLGAHDPTRKAYYQASW